MDIFFDFSVNNKELENLLHNFSVFCFSVSVSLFLTHCMLGCRVIKLLL